MRYVVLLALLAAVPSQAQTCAGVLTLTFVDPTSSARPRPPVQVREIDVRAQFWTTPVPAGTLPTAASLPGTPSRTAHLPAYGSVYVSGTALSLAPRCGTSLLNLVLTYHHQTMTLDLLHVPNHVGLAFDEPIPFRPGRYAFDFDAAEHVVRDGYRVYPASSVRQAR